jgi:hypothetical protein
MERETVGKIQIGVGCALLLITIVGSMLVINYGFMTDLVKGISSISQSWSGVRNQINGTSIGLQGHLVSYVVLDSTIVKSAEYIFLAEILILIALSAILILQGLANISKR